MKITGKSGMVSVYSNKKFSTVIGAKVTLLQIFKKKIIISNTEKTQSHKDYFTFFTVTLQDNLLLKTLFQGS